MISSVLCQFEAGIVAVTQGVIHFLNSVLEGIVLV